jgi:dolichol kinase
LSLLLGCAVPIWYYASFTFSTSLGNKGSFMLPMMGCLCVGCGDSFSAIFGSRYGTTRWSPSESGRTVEGSVAAWIGQAALIAALFYPPFQDACFPDSIVEVVDKAVPALLAMTLGTLVEAFATDNDNLLLAVYPTIAYGALLLIV